ncbi:MAG: hypothetical protein K2H52_17630 [Lachnospiraceae bacterium]|nr:hypothetical protein [Lachnospiraceae bacterium]MDE6185481.1 hypothetical protein [Lachnospiraceae bacterium]
MKKRIFLIYIGAVLLAGLLYGCGGNVPAGGERVVTETADGSERKTRSEEAILEQLAKGDIQVPVGDLADYGSGMALIDEDEPEQMVYSLVMPQIPESDDAYFYLFLAECYEDMQGLSGEPVAVWKKGRTSEVSFDYEEEYLFKQFIPAILVEGKYVPVGSGAYLLNPEMLAKNQDSYPDIRSKKGVLLDPTMLGTKELTDLEVKHTIYNIPLSTLMGETTDEAYPTIVYTFEGKEYHFNGKVVNDYDGLFSYLETLGMCSTAVVLNDWNDAHIEMIHPKARNPKSGAYYYMFNTQEEEGVKTLEAVAGFLAQRYSSGEHGMVHNWVIANEINQFKTWNYMNTKDLTYYAQEFEKSFRIFYQAIKSNYANARVYFSIDHDWNSNHGNSKNYFNARDLLAAFNDAVRAHGNYDWGIAIHPYPEPLTRVNYWSVESDKTQDAEVLTIMNLNVLTDLLGQEEYLDTEGEIRSITITELGFSSKSGEKLQAAAFAYCYFIVDANPHIDAFILNRQTDAPEEVVSGLAFGLYEYNHSEKYLKEVFCYIDTDRAQEYVTFMLNILGAESLEEALSWAE